MSFLPSGGIFRELQVVHDTGYFSAQASLEDSWQQVSWYKIILRLDFQNYAGVGAKQILNIAFKV